MVSVFSSGQLNGAEDFLQEVRAGFEEKAWVLVK